MTLGVLRSGFGPLYRGYVKVRRTLTALATTGPGATPFDPSSVRRALIVCTGLIGDTIMCLPAMAAARRLLPAAEVTALVTSTTRPLLEMGTGIERFLIADAHPLSLGPGSRRKMTELRRQIERDRYDLAVIFLGDDFAPILTSIGIPHRLFVHESAYRRLATATYGIDHPRTWGPLERLEAWRALGLHAPESSPSLRPPSTATARARSFLAPDQPERCLVVHPFGRTPDQRWPLPQVVRFISMAEEHLGLTPVVVGQGAATTGFGRTDARFRLLGRLSLEDLIGLLAVAPYAVSTDSGPLHLAGALSCRGVGLFRSSRPEHAHRYPSLTPVVSPPVERCQGRCRWDRCRATPCRQMSAIQPEEVVQALAATLHRKSPQ